MRFTLLLFALSLFALPGGASWLELWGPDGERIPGDVADGPRRDWFELQGLQDGLLMVPASRPEISEIRFVVRAGPTTPRLHEILARGDRFDLVVVELAGAGDDVSYRLALRNAALVGVHDTFDSAGAVVELVVQPAVLSWSAPSTGVDGICWDQIRVIECSPF